MNTPSPVPPAPRRRVWPWVLGICLTPFVVLGLAVASYVTLDRDASALRRHVMSATHADWNTKVQFSVGRATLGTVRTGLFFVDNEEVVDARLALGAIKHASVGVYELTSRDFAWSSQDVLATTHRAMEKRGWSRLVGVANHKETVMVYVPDDFDDDEPIDVCVAVVTGRELVVVSATVDADMLSRLVERHADGDIRAEIRRHVRF